MRIIIVLDKDELKDCTTTEIQEIVYDDMGDYIYEAEVIRFEE